MSENYPYKKVLFYFTLIPAFVGFFWGLALGLGLFHKWHNPVFSIYFLFSAIIFYSFLLFILFSIPAFFAACIYILIRLHRTWYSCFLTTFVGGCFAQFWSAIAFYRDEPWNLFVEIGASFILGSVFSLAFAFFILPKKPPKHKNNNNE